MIGSSSRSTPCQRRTPTQTIADSGRLYDVRDMVSDPSLDPVPECSHASFIHDVSPSADGCEDCLRIGGWWVHLRMCMTCGQSVVTRRRLPCEQDARDAET